MRPVLVIALALSLSGCITEEQRQTQLAAANAVSQANAQDISLAKAHRITFVEAARRMNVRGAEAARATGAMTPQLGLAFSHRSALYSQVDAGQITLEQADYQVQASALDRIQQDARTSALIAASRPQPVIVQAPAPVYQAPAPMAGYQAPVTCTTFAPIGGAAVGPVSTTTCQ